MGLVYHLECPECKKEIYMGAHITRIKCPECQKAFIENPKHKNRKIAPQRADKYVQVSPHESKTSTCPKCNTSFSTPAPLFRGKVFCPSCGTEVKLEGVTQI